MHTKPLSLIVVSLTIALAVVLGGCSPEPASSATLEASPDTPEQVVESFYRWYVGYSGNVLADGAYCSSEYLTPEFVQEVDELLASFERGGYDPFLCAQDVPAEFSVDEARVSGEEASVLVRQVWNPGTEYELVRYVTVTVRQVDGAWKIADIACREPEPASPLPEGPMPVTPEGAANGFYGWYIWYARNVGNPIADGAYRSSEYLAPEFVQEVDELLAAFDRGGYDPFLCAQDVPESYTLGEATVSGEEASLVVQTSFDGHSFTVELVRNDGRWAINGVLCAREDAGVDTSAREE